MKAKVLRFFSTIIFLSLMSSLALGEDTRVCAVDDEESTLITSINQKYLEFSSLYTGGMHFKNLGSADGSLIIYLALNNQFETIKRINSEKLGDENNQPSDIHIYDTSTYLRRFSISDWGYEKLYDISPSQVLKSALQVSFDVVPAYQHINDLKLPYSFHYRQAGFDLDFFTGLMEPVDWWLDPKEPSGINNVRRAIWRESKNNDFIDWLQFVATSSALPHLQNWSFVDVQSRKKGYIHLKRHAYKKWIDSKSYAWLAALAEVVNIDDDESMVVLNEFEKISNKILQCSATQSEKVAYGMILMNALRISYAKTNNVKDWLHQTKDDQFKPTKLKAGTRLSQYILGVDSLENYRSFWVGIGREVIIQYPQVAAISAKTTEDFIFSGDAESRNFENIELRFLSMLNIQDLLKIADQPNIPDESKRLLVRSAFLRSWIRNDLGDDILLKKMALLEPSLTAAISEVINEKNIIIRKAMLLKLVMENPGLTYLIGSELYAQYDFRNLNDFSQLNPQDGSWWCDTDINHIVDKHLNSTIKPFGLIGHNPQTSGGNWGINFYNPGQKRAYLRQENIIINSDLYKGIFNNLKNSNSSFDSLNSKEWVDFSKLPPAPVFFHKKVYELDRSKKIDNEKISELYALSAKAAKKTCWARDDMQQTFWVPKH